MEHKTLNTFSDHKYDAPVDNIISCRKCSQCILVVLIVRNSRGPGSEQWLDEMN